MTTSSHDQPHFEQATSRRAASCGVGTPCALRSKLSPATVLRSDRRQQGRPGGRPFASVAGLSESVHASRGELRRISLTGAVQPSYTACVTAAYDYEDMHHLVDRLTPTQVRRLRLLVTQDEELSQVAQTLPVADSPQTEAVPEGLLALIGSIDGPADLGERHDDYIRERMRERFGDSA